MIRENTEKSKAAYKAAKKEVKKAVAKAMEMATQKIVEDIEGNSSTVGNEKEVV